MEQRKKVLLCGLLTLVISLSISNNLSAVSFRGLIDGFKNGITSLFNKIGISSARPVVGRRSVRPRQTVSRNNRMNNVNIQRRRSLFVRVVSWFRSWLPWGGNGNVQPPVRIVQTVKKPIVVPKKKQTESIPAKAPEKTSEEAPEKAQKKVGPSKEPVENIEEMEEKKEEPKKEEPKIEEPKKKIVRQITFEEEIPALPFVHDVPPVTKTTLKKEIEDQDHPKKGDEKIKTFTDDDVSDDALRQAQDERALLRRHPQEELFDFIEDGNIGKIRELVEDYDVDVNQKSGTRTPLTWVASQGGLSGQEKYVAFRILLENGAADTINDMMLGLSPLHFVCIDETISDDTRLQIIRLLLDNGADINTQGDRSLLYWACESCSVEVICFLVEQGARELVETKILRNSPVSAIVGNRKIRENEKMDVVQFLVSNEAILVYEALAQEQYRDERIGRYLQRVLGLGRLEREQRLEVILKSVEENKKEEYSDSISFAGSRDLSLLKELYNRSKKNRRLNNALHDTLFKDKRKENASFEEMAEELKLKKGLK